jgi:hypothetical protein
VFSDADKLAAYMSCANLSCGYFNAHGDGEYTLIPALLNALEFGGAIVKKLTERYEIPEIPEPRWPGLWHYALEEAHFCPHCFAPVDDWLEDVGNLCAECGKMLSWSDLVVLEETPECKYI